MPIRLKTHCLGALLALAAVAVYAPALRGTWLWDDPTEVLHNPLLPDPAGLGKIWRGVGTPDYFPLKTSVQWLEWRLWGANVLGYHLVNLALHVAAALLLWALLRRLGVAAAYAGALLFAVHPLAVESVAWISELKNVLALPLALGSMLAFVDFVAGGKRRGRRFYAGSLGLFAAALLAKTSVAPLPCVFALYLWWRSGTLRRRELLSLAPFFAVAAALAVVTVHFQQTRVIAAVAMPPEPIATRMAAGGWAIWFYLAKCLWPAGLVPIYPRWQLVPAWAWAVPPWIALIGGGIAIARRSDRPRFRTLAFGLGTFVLLLTPILGIVPLAFTRLSWVSDHLAYPALAAFCGLAAAALGEAWIVLRSGGSAGVAGGAPRAPLAAAATAEPGATADAAPPGQSHPFPPRAWRRFIAWPSAAPVVALLAILAAAGVSAYHYSAVFGDEQRLWRYTAARNPSAWLAWNNLGIIDAQSGRREAAIAELQTAVTLQPELEGARLNLGRALAASGRLREAVPQFSAALQVEPGNADARDSLRAVHNNLGTALARAGKLEAAVAEFRSALAVDPRNAGVHQNLGYALQGLGKGAEAQREFEAASGLRNSTGRP